MPRKLKTYQTSIGFYDLAIAAPSMKAALEAWGAGSNLFHQGAAQETDDPEVVTATVSKPGVVLMRAAGSNGRFTEHADLPDIEDEGSARKKSPRPEPRRRPAKISEKTHVRPLRSSSASKGSAMPSAAGKIRPGKKSEPIARS
jgi:colicin import membrane protein